MSKNKSLILVALLMSAMVGCSEKAPETVTDTKKSEAVVVNQVEEVQDATASTTEGDSFKFEIEGGGFFRIKPEEGDSEYAKQFLKTGLNAYSEEYKTNSIAAQDGRKLFLLNSCSACHGPHGDGLSGPSITDERWNVTRAGQSDRGMFELIAAGSQNGMGARHKQTSGNKDLLSTDDILKMIGWLRTEYKGPENTKTWEGQGVAAY